MRTNAARERGVTIHQQMMRGNRSPCMIGRICNKICRVFGGDMLEYQAADRGIV